MLTECWLMVRLSDLFSYRMMNAVTAKLNPRTKRAIWVWANNLRPDLQQGQSYGKSKQYKEGNLNGNCNGSGSRNRNQNQNQHAMLWYVGVYFKRERVVANSVNQAYNIYILRINLYLYHPGRLRLQIERIIYIWIYIYLYIYRERERERETGICMHLTLFEVNMQTSYDEQTWDSMQLVVKRKRVIYNTKPKSKSTE